MIDYETGVCRTCGIEMIRERFECVGEDGELYCDSSCKGENDALREYEQQMLLEMAEFYLNHPGFPGAKEFYEKWRG